MGQKGVQSMRVLSLPAIFLASTLVLAQPGAGTPQLDEVLTSWERSLTALQSLQADCQRTELDKVFQTKEVFKGTARYMKASSPGQGSRASLELFKMTPKGPDPNVFEKYICTGTYLYEYAPASKLIRIHDLPKPQSGQVADDNFLSFLFGMKAAEAKQRYQLALTPSDQYYHYIHIQAKLPQDKAEFTVARLTIRRDNFLPAQVWFHKPNGNEITWDFQARSNVPMPANLFEQPRLPSGWKFERIPDQAKPKVRGNAG
jgi:TIGR03009 family protein